MCSCHTRDPWRSRGLVETGPVHSPVVQPLSSYSHVVVVYYVTIVAIAHGLLNFFLAFWY